MNYISNIFKGRVSRSDYFLFWIVTLLPIGAIPLLTHDNSLIGSFMFKLFSNFSNSILIFFIVAYIIIVFMFNLGISIRRGHDIGWSGVFTFFMIILSSFIYIPQLFLFFKKGKDGVNKYGIRNKGRFWQRFFNINDNDKLNKENFSTEFYKYLFHKKNKTNTNIKNFSNIEIERYYQEGSFLDYFFYNTQNIDKKYFLDKNLIYYFNDVVLFYLYSIDTANVLLNKENLNENIRKSLENNKSGLQFSIFPLSISEIDDINSSLNTSILIFLFESIDCLNKGIPKTYYLENPQMKETLSKTKQEAFLYMKNISDRFSYLIINKRPKSDFLKLWIDTEKELKIHNYFKS